MQIKSYNFQYSDITILAWAFRGHHRKFLTCSKASRFVDDECHLPLVIILQAIYYNTICITSDVVMRVSVQEKSVMNYPFIFYIYKGVTMVCDAKNK